MSFLDFDRIAAARGDGLRPELRALMERRAALQSAPQVADIAAGDTGRVQTGANPPALPDFLPGNVARFPPKAGDRLTSVQAEPSRG